MSLRNAAGRSLSRFAHLSGLASAKGRAEDNDDKKRDDDEERAEDEDEGDEEEKRDAKSADDDDDMEAEGGDGEDDDEEEEDKEKDAKSARAIRSAERARCAAIFAAKAADGRIQLADHLAFGTALPARQAIALLAAAPREDTGRAGLSQRMAGVKDIRVGEDATADTPATPAGEAAAQATRILARARAAGAKF
jgi:hypothetical protein